VLSWTSQAERWPEDVPQERYLATTADQDANGLIVLEDFDADWSRIVHAAQETGTTSSSVRDQAAAAKGSASAAAGRGRERTALWR